MVFIKVNKRIRKSYAVVVARWAMTTTQNKQTAWGLIKTMTYS